MAIDRLPSLTLEATEIAGGKKGSFATNRYDRMLYRRCGHSGLMLPAISLGSWKTFGGYCGPQVARDCLYRAFNLGITHFDFANNYGTPPGTAELICGEIIRSGLPRDELIISSKAGHRMWPGPYGEWLNKKTLIASCDQSLKRLKLDYLDIFYLHRSDPNTPLEESLNAMDLLIRQGKVLYGGVSSWSDLHHAVGTNFNSLLRIREQQGSEPITVHQPNYNMLIRTIEWDLLPHTERAGVGVIAFMPLASGLLTNKYLSGVIPPDSRAALQDGEKVRQWLTSRRLTTLHKLNDFAHQRGQSLAQMSIAWCLRHSAVTSVLIGVSKVEQLDENIQALDNLEFSPDELEEIDTIIKDL